MCMKNLAYQIIHLYGDLVNYVNEQGYSPLHLLASKPSAFRSGSHISSLNKIIYHFFGTRKEEAQKSGGQGDAENPEAGHQGNQSTNGLAHRNKLFPCNYDILFEYIKLVSKAMLVILGLGSRKIRKLQIKKEKHTWSVQIMNELLQRASIYEYEDNGRNPQQSPPPKDGETAPYAVVEGGTVTFGSSVVLEEDQQPETSTALYSETNQEDQNKGNKGEGDPLVL
ncbi:hypothetical protein L1049_004120 [Liquidambar formosana]|uniref:Uncharacterized protein n=1 Tax=Liquidambar formosana TaxID=63359 RepID=A0AAP0RSQ9_LIQFO